MRLRIVRYKNGKYGIERRFFFIWWSVTSEDPAGNFPITYDTWEEVKKEYDRLTSDRWAIQDVYYVR